MTVGVPARIHTIFRSKCMTGIPERLRSEVAFEGRLITVRVDDVRLPTGKETVREVVEHTGSAVILPVTEQGEILFVRQYRYPIGQELIELPAGLVDDGETPLETARRELTEETGHVSDNWREIATCYPSAGFADERVTIFLAQNCLPVEWEADPHEGLALEHWSHDQLMDAVMSEPFPFENAATSIAVLWYATHWRTIRSGSGNAV
jgi:ADP-ribose pyrophosphatase